MAIDPSIPLAIRPVQIQVPQGMSPFQLANQALSLRGLMMQNQMADLQLKQAQAVLQEQQQFAQEWIRANQTNPPAAMVAPTAPVAPGALATTPLGPVAPAAPTAPFFPIPELQPGPAVPSTAPLAPIADPFRGIGASVTTPSVDSGSNLPSPSPQAPALQAPATAPTAAVPPVQGMPPLVTGAAGTQSILPPGMTLGSLFTKYPHIGLSIGTNLMNAQKAQAEMDLKTSELNQKNADRIASFAWSVLHSQHPELARVDAIMQASREKVFGPNSDQIARAILARPYNPDDYQQLVDRAPTVKTFHETAIADAKARTEALDTGLVQGQKLIANVNDQAGWDKVFPSLPPEAQRVIGPTFSPQLKNFLETYGTTPEQRSQMAARVPTTFMANVQATGQALSAIAAQGPDALATAIQNIKDPIIRQMYTGATTEAEIQKRALAPHEAITAREAEQQHKITAVNEALRLRMERQRLENEYPAGSDEFNAEQIYQNPDAVKDILPKQRQGAAHILQQKYGLPLPTALSATAQAQETAGRTTLENIQWIRDQLKNPAIRDNVGPIMSRIKDVELATGDAGGLSPQDAALAQEFRTRMRQFIFGEARAQFQSKVPQGLFKSLEESAPRIDMNAGRLEGALSGVEGNTRQILRDIDKQRFGGKARPDEVRGLPSVGGVPAGVRQALQGKETGVIQHLKNNRTGEVTNWILSPDGSIRQVP